MGRHEAHGWDSDMPDGDLLAAVVAHYAAALADHDDARAWLSTRGIEEATAARFGVGFSARTLGLVLPEGNRRAGALLRSRLQALGVLRSTGHELFRGCVVIPVHDERGVVMQLVGYRIGRARDERGTPGVLSLPNPSAVWNPAALGAAEVLVAGSLVDALVWWQTGFAHTVATAGPDPIDTLASALAEAAATRALLAHPRPEGEPDAAALAERLGSSGVGCFRVVLPRGVDAAGFAAEISKPVEALGALVRAATWMGAGPAPIPTAASDPPPSPRSEPGAVSPLPAPACDPVVETVGAELRMTIGDRAWRVRGLDRVGGSDALRVNVGVTRVDAVLGELFHLDTLDLYTARARAAFVHAAAGEVRIGPEVVRRDMGRLLVACEAHVEALATAARPEPTRVELSAVEEAAALELLCDPALAERIVADVERVGVVGEATNVLVAYLAAVSRKLDTPLAVLVQSTSAAGKSSLMEAVLGLVPPEDRVSFSAVTGQSLFYVGEHDLAHRVLSVAEEHGAARAAYALKLLQSEGELSIASTGKDAGSGRLVTQTYRVAGPVALFLTTTAADLDEELTNRCVVVAVDEDRAQTRAIHDAQRARQTLDGLMAAAERDEVIKLHRDAQRLLEPVAVVNPFAPQLGFPDGRTRTRRDHVKYLTLIRAVALLHQHQRPRRTARHAGVEVTFIEVTPADIALANRLAHEVLGRSLDELSPQTRRLLTALHGLVVERARAAGVEQHDVRFSRREVREHVGWSDFQVRVHLGRLVDLEHVLVHRGGRGLSFVYELIWDGGGTDGQPHLAGLTDASALRACDYDPHFEPLNGQFEPPSSPLRAPIEGGSREATA
jgi:energy-coupling factor transporter ATP-binding protein EcfA2